MRCWAVALLMLGCGGEIELERADAEPRVGRDGGIETWLGVYSAQGSCPDATRYFADIYEVHITPGITDDVTFDVWARSVSNFRSECEWQAYDADFDQPERLFCYTSDKAKDFYVHKVPSTGQIAVSVVFYAENCQLTGDPK